MCLCTFTHHRSHKKAQNIKKAKIFLGGTFPRALSYNPSYVVIHCWQWCCHVNWLSEHVFIDTCVFVFMLFLYSFFYSQFQQMWRAYPFQWSHCFSAIQYCSRFSDILPVSAVWVNLLANELCVWTRWEVDSRSLPSGLLDDTNTNRCNETNYLSPVFVSIPIHTCTLHWYYCKLLLKPVSATLVVSLRHLTFSHG